MEVNIRKIFGLILMIILLSLIFSGKVFASEATLSYPNTCEKGESFTVTVNIPKDAVAYDIGGASVTFSDGSSQTLNRKGNFNPSSKEWPGNCSFTFEAKVSGNANISVYDIVIVDTNANTINGTDSLSGSINITESNNSVPTQPAENNSQPDSTPPPVEVVVVNFKDVNETMYVTEASTGVNMRQNCGTGDNIGLIRTLQPGTEVTRTGIGDKSKDGYSWSRISYNGETGYVITSRLTYDKPEEKPPENTVENNTVSNNEISNNTVNNVVNNLIVNGIKNIADELGAIPEVGLNIMTFIFVGSCSVCSIIIIYVKRKIAK